MKQWKYNENIYISLIFTNMNMNAMNDKRDSKQIMEWLYSREPEVYFFIRMTMPLRLEDDISFIDSLKINI